MKVLLLLLLLVVLVLVLVALFLFYYNPRLSPADIHLAADDEVDSPKRERKKVCDCVCVCVCVCVWLSGYRRRFGTPLAHPLPGYDEGYRVIIQLERVLRRLATGSDRVRTESKNGR